MEADKKIRILHFELDNHLGGIEMFLLNLMKVIDRDRFQFEFVASNGEPALKEEFEKLGGIIHYIPTARNIMMYKKTVKQLVNNNFDVVHVHKNSAANIIPIVEARNAKKKIVVHSHNTCPTVGGFTSVLHKVNFNRLNLCTDYRYACSTEAGKWLFGNNSFDIVRNGIITSSFKYDERKRVEIRNNLSVPFDTFLCGNIGRFTSQKNHKRLVRIFEKINEINSNSRLILVGDGGLKEATENLVADLNLREKIIFLGIRNDIPELLMAMDAFIMPSLYEGLPIVAVEAQTTGLRTFLSDTVSKETEVTDLTTWFSLEDSDSDIANLILNHNINNSERSLYSKMMFDNGYDIKSTAEKIAKIYERLCFNEL